MGPLHARCLQVFLAITRALTFGCIAYFTGTFDGSHDMHLGNGLLAKGHFPTLDISSAHAFVMTPQSLGAQHGKPLGSQPLSSWQGTFRTFREPLLLQTTHP